LRRPLVWREMLRGVLGQFGLRSLGRRRELYEGDNFLTAFCPADRTPNDRGTDDCGMRVQHRLDFRRVYILPKANDQFLGSAYDKQIAVLQSGKVAGVEPSIRIVIPKRSVF